MSEIKDRLIPTDLEEEMKRSFISYAMAVIVNRALPDVRDGLKPVHRRILYAMHELGMTPDKPFRKCARIVGDVLGKYHPHGDSSVYDAMVRLAQDFSIRYLLVEGQGNFGSVDGDGAAAMRYTEAKMSKLSTHLIGEIDKDTVDFYPNFDETLMQPSVLPSRFPNLLVNGSSGIAVGMATNIPSHNLGEVIDAVIAMIDDPDISLPGLMEHIKGPDFPTGATILGRSGILEAYATGRGRITVRAKSEVEVLPNGRNRIIVSEIPYMVNKARMVQKIAELVHEKRLEGISDIRDESDRNGMRVVIDLKKDVQSSVVLNYLYKHTQMQDTFGAIMLALVDGQPRVLTLREMIGEYIRHQQDVVTRRTQYELDKSQARAHILLGLLKALDHIDEVVRIIRGSRDVGAAKEALIQRLELSDVQAQAILDMRLARLTSLEADKLKAEYEDLLKTIARLQGILADESLLFAVVKEELTDLRDRFADPRRTEISADVDDINIADLIPVDDMVVTLTHLGYVKRLSKSTYRAQVRGGKGVAAMTTREEDYAEQIYVVNSHEDILFFTNRGRVHTLKCFQIPEAGRTARGTAIVNILQLAGGEKVTTMIPLPGSFGVSAMQTDAGPPAEEDSEELLRTDAELSTEEGGEAQLRTDAGLSAEEDGEALSESDAGPPVEEDGEALYENDDELSAEEDAENKYLVMATRDGLIKKTPLGAFRNLRRVGMIAIVLRDEDELVGVELTDGEKQLMLATRGGQAICFHEQRVNATGRASQGVRSMRLGAGDQVIALSLVEEGAQVLTIAENGYGKRTETDAFREQGRAGKGLIAMRLTAKTGDLAAMLMVRPEEDILIITDDGTVIRTPVDEIRICGRATQGVRMMRVAEGSRIVGVARAEAEEEEEPEAQIDVAAEASLEPDRMQDL